MKKRFTEEQTVGAIKEHGIGVKAKDICRRFGISNGTHYNWQAKFQG